MFWKAVVPLGLMSWGLFYVTAGILTPERRRNDHLEIQAKQYLDRALPPILNGFRYNEWRKRATVELITSSKHPELKQAFKEMKVRYGPLRKMEEAVASTGVDEIRGRQVPWATFRTRAYFRYGEAPIVGKIVYRAGGWKFQQLSIRSDIGLYMPDEDSDRGL